MSFSINLGNWNKIFAVPCCIVDEHIKLAGATQLKALLWILRHAGENFTINDIANALSMHPADAKDAVQYWVETNVICIDDEFITPAKNNSKIQNKNNIEPANQIIKSEPIKTVKRPLSRPQKPDPQFITKRITEDKEIASLMQEAQVILGRTISNSDCALLLMFHDNDGLPIDVIIMLLQYCASIGKSNMRYIEKVAISWASEEINTLQKAENKIRSLSKRRKAWNTVQKIIGLEKRLPTLKEDDCSNRWINEWGFGEDMVKEAFERCVDNKGKYIASYMDSIMKRWFNNGIFSIEQANNEKALQKQNKTSSNNSHKASYNIKEFESFSIFDNE